MAVSIVLIATLMFGTVTNATMFITMTTCYSGVILLMSGENKRRWLKDKKQMATIKPRKVSREEFKAIMKFCKENNLGHLTVPQAIVAWDEYRTTH